MFTVFFSLSCLLHVSRKWLKYFTNLVVCTQEKHSTSVIFPRVKLVTCAAEGGCVFFKVHLDARACRSRSLDRCYDAKLTHERSRHPRNPAAAAVDRNEKYIFTQNANLSTSNSLRVF